MSQNINLIIECDYTECPYNCENECDKDILYIDDSECKAQMENKN